MKILMKQDKSEKFVNSNKIKTENETKTQGTAIKQNIILNIAYILSIIRLMQERYHLVLTYRQSELAYTYYTL